MRFLAVKRLRNILSIAAQAFFNYKKQIAALTVLGFLSGLLESIGVNALIPLFSFATKSAGHGDDLVTRFIQKIFYGLNINFSIKYLLLFIVLMFVLKAIMLIIASYLSVKITANYEQTTRTELFKKTFDANWPHLIKQKLGYLENTVMVDVQYSAGMLQQLSDTIMVATGLVMYALIAVNISLIITAITLFLGACLFFLFRPTMHSIKTNAEKMAAENKNIAHFINQSIVGLKTVKAGRVEEKLLIRAKALFGRINFLKIKIFLLRNVVQSLIQPISLIFICVIFAIYYKLPGFNLPAMIAIVYLIQRIFQYIQQLQVRFQAINEAYPYLSNVLKYKSEAKLNQEQNSGKNNWQFKNQLVFTDVSFAYQSPAPVLNKINFSLKKGTLAGLIGPSGAGKTTLVDLILRLYEPQTGHITLDNRLIGQIDLNQWRKKIGYVSQDMFLLNDTVAANIKFYQDDLSEEKITTAARMANIDDFIQTLPNKYQTIIGERGSLLSAGQRQRIIIARVLCQQPELLILDEATSALDNESELKIQQVLENLKGKITILAIAHRLSTVVKSDQLLVLENGRIAEQGRPAELLADKDSYFYKLYNIRQ